MPPDDHLAQPYTKDLTAVLIPARPYWRRDADQIQAITVHHTATPRNTTAEAIHHAHVLRGWAGIGYHALVWADGTSALVRPLLAVPAAVAGHNRRILAVALVDHLDLRQPTQDALHTLAQILTHWRQVFAKTLPILRHSDLAATRCPGQHYPHARVLAMVRQMEQA
jgi:hypothetical protein